MRQRFLSATARVREQRFVVRGKEYRNVIASFGPDRPDDPVVIVGAHYDVFSPRRQPFPGADDNASGTAALFELARLLAAHPPAVPVDLDAFANEEPPFFGSDEMGSAIHAASLRRPVTAMLCLEMIGDFHHDQMAVSSLLQSFYPRRGNFVAVCGGWGEIALTRRVKRAMQTATALPVLSFTGPHSMTDASDQRSYWVRGIPAVMITDTAYLRNPNYHTLRDTAATLDYDAMAEVVDGVLNAVAQ